MSTIDSNSDSVPFCPYPSIENVSGKNVMERIRAAGYDSKEIVWQASEKIHGSNFSIVTNGIIVRYGRRTALLGPKEGFNGYERLKDELSKQALSIFQILKQEQPTLTTITIFGELFGGVYTHPDVKRINGVSTIQREIQYSPNLHFHAFDILCDGKTFIDCDTFGTLCDAVSLIYAKPLKRGTLDECLTLPIEGMITTIPTLFNLPPIDNNIWEGVVTRPIKPLMIDDERVIIKNKTRAFQETKVAVEKPVKSKPTLNVSETLQTMMDETNGAVVRARLISVLSKLDTITEPSQIGKLTPLFAQDVIKDMEKEYIDTITKLTVAEKKQWLNYVTKTCATFVATSKQAILDKTF